MIAIYTAIGIAVSLLVIFYPIYRNRKQVSELAEKKWEEEDKTIFVPYGNHLIPILQSQSPQWTAMSDDEKWWMLNHLKAEVKGGRLSVEKENGITRFVGITHKAKDIKHRQKQRTEGWKS
jgi:uncharacterized membrane protein